MRGRSLLSLFIVVTLVAVVVTNLPESLLRRRSRRSTDPYLKATGLDQSWRIFAPNPRQISLRLEARVRYDDGSVVVWQPPAGGDLVGRLLGLPLAQVARERDRGPRARRPSGGPPRCSRPARCGDRTAPRDSVTLVVSSAGAAPTRGAGPRPRPLASEALYTLVAVR